MYPQDPEAKQMTTMDFYRDDENFLIDLQSRPKEMWRVCVRNLFMHVVMILEGVWLGRFIYDKERLLIYWLLLFISFAMGVGGTIYYAFAMIKNIKCQIDLMNHMRSKREDVENDRGRKDCENKPENDRGRKDCENKPEND